GADAESALLVSRPDRRRQSVRAVVHQPHRLVVVGDLLYAHDGAEALLDHQAVHRVVRVGHQAGVEEPPAARRVVRRLATAEHAPSTMFATAWPGSASGATYAGSLPPSSSPTSMKRLAPSR